MRLFILMFIIFLSHLANASAESIFQYKRIDFFQDIETQNEPAIAQTNTSSEVIQE